MRWRFEHQKDPSHLAQIQKLTRFIHNVLPWSVQSDSFLCSYFEVLVHWQIKYGEVGWKERYYAEKFEAETEDDCERIRQDVVGYPTHNLVTVWLHRSSSSPPSPSAPPPLFFYFIFIFIRNHTSVE